MSQFSTPEGLERHHVRDVYDKIAPYFVGSRHKAWPRVEQFLLSLPAGSLIADVGAHSDDDILPKLFLLLFVGHIHEKRNFCLLAEEFPSFFAR
ncbi:hypothetical protein ABFA07_014724 [Porites harrisoni]